MPLYKTCPACGASLDHGEACTCGGKVNPAEYKPPERSAVRPRSNRRNGTKHEGARYELCRGCDLVWNVSRMYKAPPHGYLCPRCWSQMRNKNANDKGASS